MPLQTFIALHTHEYGTSVKVFQSTYDAEAIFNALPNPEFDFDADGDLTRIDFADRINIDYEPDKGETLTVELFNPENHEPVDFGDFQ